MLALVPDLMMLVLLIYMAELMSVTPLHTVWLNTLEQITKQENPSLLDFSCKDKRESIACYNRTASENADIIILNILNNLTKSSDSLKDQGSVTMGPLTDSNPFSVYSCNEDEIYGPEDNRSSSSEERN